MIRGVKRPCVVCGTLIARGSRCAQHQVNLYVGDYVKASALVRANAQTCWLCGDGARVNDPWTADHVDPGDPLSELREAHRSCNSRRGDAGRRP